MTKVTAADDLLQQNELTLGAGTSRSIGIDGGLEYFMFAVDHSATALLIKRRFPSVSMTPLLVSVQAMELAWVALNYLGVEQTTTSATVRSVADIHLAYIPSSHSVATVTAAAVVAWWAIERGLGRRALGRAVATGIVLAPGS